MSISGLHVVGKGENRTDDELLVGVVKSDAVLPQAFLMPDFCASVLLIVFNPNLQFFDSWTLDDDMVDSPIPRI